MQNPVTSYLYSYSRSVRFAFWSIEESKDYMIKFNGLVNCNQTCNGVECPLYILKLNNFRLSDQINQRLLSAVTCAAEWKNRCHFYCRVHSPRVYIPVEMNGILCKRSYNLIRSILTYSIAFSWNKPVCLNSVHTRWFLCIFTRYVRY